jgi:septal ring factor EnvC (AmiA/AmiB activator)
MTVHKCNSCLLVTMTQAQICDENDQLKKKVEELTTKLEDSEKKVLKLQAVKSAAQAHLEYVEKRIDLMRQMDNQDAERDLMVDRDMLKDILSGTWPMGRNGMGRVIR